jgi:hypothetical protein
MNAGSVLRTGMLAALVATALAFAAAASAAPRGLGITCPDPLAQPFAPWGDSASYAFVPDGGFESGAAGWSLAGAARISSGNEPFFVHGARDRSSFRLSVGSSATTPPMCIALLASKMRFFIGGPAGSTVKVQIIYNGLVSSVLGILDGGTVSSDGTWRPSASVSMLGGLLPLLTKSVQFRFVATAGAPQIDDVYLDPWKVL